MLNIETLRRATLALAIVFPLGSGATASRAEEIAFASEDILARWLLPYAPIVFDLAVQSGRSVAEISYGRRGFDPLTGSFYVNGLHVKRDFTDVTIGRLRLGPRQMLLEGVEVDTRSLDLPPPLRKALQQIGRDTITGDILVNVGINAGRSAYDIAMQYEFADIGAFAMTATIDGVHVLVPLSDLENANMVEQPVVSGTLHRASIAYRDYGAVDVALQIAAQDAGVTADQLRAGLMSMPIAMVGGLLDELPGGASPALREAALAWARIVESFLKDGDAIRVTVEPQEPVPLARLQAGVLDEALITALNPSVSNSFDVDTSVGDTPEGALGEASALISGQGAPQNREAGAQVLLGLAASGDIEAVRKLGSAFGSAALPDLDPPSLAALYSHLLVARALDGGSVSDAALARLASAIGAEAQLQAERDAASFFYTRTEEGKQKPQLSGENVTEWDANSLRARAYDLYEGRGIPRSFTDAYAVALVAAAAGDPFAARLRDDIAAALEQDRIVLSLPDSRAQADELWAAYSPNDSSGDDEPAPPQGGAASPKP